MASVREGVDAPNLSRSSAELGHDIERMQAEMERGIQIGGIRNDPTLPLIKALSTSLGLQWRLHDQAVAYFRSASERLDRQLADTIAQGEQSLAARRIAVVESLAPELAKVVTKTVRTWSRSVTLKTAFAFGSFAVALALGVGLAAYGAGWQAGHTSALNTDSALASAIHEAGLDAETALVNMIRANNLAEAWAQCQKTATSHSDGRRVCSMPMWAAPEPQTRD